MYRTVPLALLVRPQALQRLVVSKTFDPLQSQLKVGKPLHFEAVKFATNGWEFSLAYFAIGAPIILIRSILYLMKSRL